MTELYIIWGFLAGIVLPAALAEDLTDNNEQATRLAIKKEIEG